MPYYDYRCSDCGNYFEEMHSIRDNVPTVQCPRCKGMAIRQIGAPLLNGKRNKGPGRGQNQVAWERPDPAKETKLQLRAIEDAGKMTPEIAQYGETHLKALERDTALGKIKKEDWGKDGHPCERPLKDYEY